MWRLQNVSVVIFLNERDEILLQKKDMLYRRWPWVWCLFGWSINKNEDPFEWLKRELQEEIEYDLKQAKLYQEYSYVDEVNNTYWIIYVYIARFEKCISTIAIHEWIWFAFFTEDEIKKLALIDHHENILNKYFEDKIR